MATSPATTPDEALVREISASGSEPDWLAAHRLDSLARHAALPAPALTDERWRRTDLRGLDPAAFTAASRNGQPDATATAANSLLAGVEFGGQNVQADWWHQANSLAADLQAAGVIFTSMEAAVRDHPDLVRKSLTGEPTETSLEKFEALQSALWRGGNFLYVPDGVEIELPLHSLLWMTQSDISTQVQTSVIVGKRARVQFVDEQASETASSPAIAGARIDAYIDDGGTLDYACVQDWGLHTAAFKTVRARLGRDANFNYVEFAMGAGLVKSFVEGTMPEPGASLEMWGLSLLDGRRHIDNETHQHHIADHTFSNLLYKGVLRERGRSVFYGMITIDDTAGQSNSYQANNNLLLSKEARADSIPGMEIKTYDVRCTHGATISRVDEEELYYLQSRGFTRAQAEWLAVRGYVGPVLDRLKNEPVRDAVEAAVLARAGRD